MKELLKEKYVEEKEDLSPKLKKTFAAVTKLPQLQAVKAWQDTNAEIKLKRALDRMICFLLLWLHPVIVLLKSPIETSC